MVKKYMVYFLLFLIPIFLGFSNTQGIEGSIVSIEPTKGKVSISQDMKIEKIAKVGDKVGTFDVITTAANTRATILVENVQVNLGPWTKVKLIDAYRKEKKIFELWELNRGGTDVKVNNSYNSLVSFKTNSNTILVTGTEFYLSSAGEIRVSKGQVKEYETSFFDDLRRGIFDEEKKPLHVVNEGFRLQGRGVPQRMGPDYQDFRNPPKFEPQDHLKEPQITSGDNSNKEPPRKDPSPRKERPDVLPPDDDKKARRP